MRFRLDWKPSAVEKLAALYLAGKARSSAKAITKAMAAVERVLAADPLGVGESREGRERIMFEPPLTIEYEVFEDARTVIVFDLRLNIPKA